MKILAITSRSVTVETENSTPYFSPEKYSVFLNGAKIKEENRNIFSLFNLKPDSSYEINANC